MTDVDSLGIFFYTIMDRFYAERWKRGFVMYRM